MQFSQLQKSHEFDLDIRAKRTTMTLALCWETSHHYRYYSWNYYLVTVGKLALATSPESGYETMNHPLRLYADWKSLKFPVDMIWGRSLRRGSLSISLDKVLKFVTSLKFDISDLSSHGFFSIGVTRPHFSEDEKTPSLNDKLASLKKWYV